MITFIPFGENCAPAFALKNSGLRKYSLPFDWILADATLLKKSLDVECKNWFDQDKLFNVKELISIDESEGVLATAHKDYVPDSGYAFFSHFNLKDENIVKKIKKRVDLFYSIINSDSEIFFITSASYEDFKQNNLLDYFDRSAKTSIIFIKYDSSLNKIKIDNIDKYLLILYGGEDEWDQDQLARVGDFIRDNLNQ